LFDQRRTAGDVTSAALASHTNAHQYAGRTGISAQLEFIQNEILRQSSRSWRQIKLIEHLDTDGFVINDRYIPDTT
jgi:hypothetical protein